MLDTPMWYNNPSCAAVSSRGLQLGSTCGLFAVNHLVAGSAMCGLAAHTVIPRSAFEANAMEAGLGDSPASLIQQGGSN